MSLGGGRNDVSSGIWMGGISLCDIVFGERMHYGSIYDDVIVMREYGTCT